MHDHEKQIPIWFFIGCLLTIYGVLIFGSGIYNLVRPSANPVALDYLHVGIWWGILLIAVGMIYVIKYRPGAEKADVR
jgi:hypothetical protein